MVAQQVLLALGEPHGRRIISPSARPSARELTLHGARSFYGRERSKMNQEPTGSSLPNLLTRQEVAAILRCSVRTVRRRLSPGLRIGRLARYRREDIQALIKPEAAR